MDDNFQKLKMISLGEKFLSKICIKINSKKTYRRSLKQFFEFLCSNNINNLEQSLIIEFIDYLRNKKLSDYTINNYITTLKKFYSWGASEGYFEDISIDIKVKKTTRGFRKKALNIAQIKRLNNALGKDNLSDMRDCFLINLMIRTGLRTIEINRLNFGDIRKSGNDTILFVHGKGRSGKDDFVFLTKKTCSFLREYISKLEKFGIKVSDEMPIFISLSKNNYMKALTTRSISRIVKNAFIKIGLNGKDYTAHSLRHTAVTLCLLGGATIQEAQILARHNNINTTLIYAQNISRIKCAPEKYIDKIL